jgi:hypothetical protein
VPASAVMGYLPFRIDDGTLPNFDDAIAGHKSDRFRRFNEINVSPLVTVIVNVIGYLAE